MGNETGQPSQENATTRNTTPYEWNNEKMMHKWNKDDVKDYIKSLTYTECTRNVMKKKINGKDLLLAKTADDLAKKLNIHPDKAEGLFELINIQKRREVGKKVKHTPKSADSDDIKYAADEDDCEPESAIITDIIRSKKQFLIDHKNQKKFTKKMDYNLNFKGSDSWQGRKMINWTVYNMKSWFVSEFNGTIYGTIRKQVLDAMDEILLNGAQMNNIEDGAMLSAALNINGKICKMIYDSYQKQMDKEADDDEKYEKKSKLMDENEYNRIRMLPYDKYTWIRLCAEPDCIIGYTDEDNIFRAEMPCKHAIAADTMFLYIKSIIEKNKEAVVIKCPVEKCDTEWDWDSCLKIADMSKQEIIKYNAIKSNRMRRKTFKNCPNPKCGVKTAKPKTLNQFRVACTRCNSYDWCFICQQKWKGRGVILCGNTNCTVVSSVNKILKECDMTPITLIKNGEVPKYRACPKCLTLIQHTKYCKHMRCLGCKTEFCFLCLAIRDSKKGWPASCKGWSKSTKWEAGANVSCKLADRQYFK